MAPRPLDAPAAVSVRGHAGHPAPDERRRGFVTSHIALFSILLSRRFRAPTRHGEASWPFRGPNPGPQRPCGGHDAGSAASEGCTSRLACDSTRTALAGDGGHRPRPMHRGGTPDARRQSSRPAVGLPVAPHTRRPATPPAPTDETGPRAARSAGPCWSCVRAAVSPKRSSRGFQSRTMAKRAVAGAEESASALAMARKR